MGIGGGILLLAVGAILTFAVEADPGWLRIDVVGVVLMLAGVAMIALTLWFWQNRRRGIVAPVARARLSRRQHPTIVDPPPGGLREPPPPAG